MGYQGSGELNPVIVSLLKLRRKREREIFLGPKYLGVEYSVTFDTVEATTVNIGRGITLLYMESESCVSPEYAVFLYTQTPCFTLGRKK